MDNKSTLTCWTWSGKLGFSRSISSMWWWQ